MIFFVPTFLYYIWIVAFVLTLLPDNWVSQWYSLPLFLTVFTGAVCAVLISIGALRIVSDL